MLPIDAFVDEARLACANLNIECAGLVAVLQRLRLDGAHISKHPNIYYATLSPTGADLVTLLYGQSDELDDDIKRALMLQIDSASSWDCPIDDTTGVHVLHDMPPGRARCCVSTISSRGTVYGGVPCISTPKEACEFYTRVPEIVDADEELYIAIAQRAFGQLMFRPGIAADLRRFSVSYREIRPTLTRALRALNDELAALLDAVVPVPELPMRFESATGFGLSPESPQTHGNKKAMRERIVRLDDTDFMCEWHLKIRPDGDRIHLHFYHPGIGNGRQMLIGIFCEHLTT